LIEEVGIGSLVDVEGNDGSNDRGRGHRNMCQGVDQVEDQELEARIGHRVDVVLAHEAGRGQDGGEGRPDVFGDVPREDEGVGSDVDDDEGEEEEGGELPEHQDEQDDGGKPEGDDRQEVEEAFQGS